MSDTVGVGIARDLRLKTWVDVDQLAEGLGKDAGELTDAEIFEAAQQQVFDWLHRPEEGAPYVKVSDDGISHIDFL